MKKILSYIIMGILGVTVFTACRRYVQIQACGWKIACYRY